MNYMLRCTPPSAIAEQADQFDSRILTAAMDKLALHPSELGETTIRLLQSRLSDGGFGFTSAVRTSPAAYLGSLAAVKTAPVFAPYCKASQPLPSTTLLHDWIATSIERMVMIAPGASKHLPPTASSFFAHYATASSSLSSSLQSTLSSQANSYSHEASLTALRDQRKRDGGSGLAHALAISAPRACAWKTVAPTTPLLTLNDRQYRIAARLNLNLTPLTGMGKMPDTCPACRKQGVLKKDAWHALSCNAAMKGELYTRHNAVVDALYHMTLTVGGQAVRQPLGLQIENGRVPDLQMVFPGQHILTDVVISHSLAPGWVKYSGAARGAVARKKQLLKHCYVSITESTIALLVRS
jgi:hypothetical protein